MAKAKSVIACSGCQRLIDKEPGPNVCTDCWSRLTPAEKCARWEANKVESLLLAIKHELENNAYLAKQTARLAKALEALLRELKEPFDSLQGLVDRWNRRIEQDREEYDEGERWKEGLAGEDEFEE